jgi:MFS family permease
MKNSSSNKSFRSIINRDTLTICALAFINDLGYGIITPIAVLYARSLGASFTFIGSLVSIQSFIFIFFALPFGIYSDRKGRKPLILIGRLITALNYFFYSIITSFYHLLPLRIFQSFGMLSIRSSFRAYIADVTESEKLDEVTGLYMVSMGLGVIIGPLIGGWVVNNWGYRTTYLFSSFMGLIGFLLALVGLRGGIVTGLKNNIQQEKKTPEIIEKPTLRGSVNIILKNPALMSALILSSLNSLIFSLIYEYFPSYAKDIGFTVVEIGNLFFIRGIFTTLIRFPITLIGKKYGNKIVMISSMILAILSLFLIPSFQDFNSLAIIMAIQGACFGSFIASFMVYLFKIIDESQRGITLAVDTVFLQMLSMFYGPIRGTAADTFGVQGAFPFMASICLFGTILALIISSKKISSRFLRTP